MDGGTKGEINFEFSTEVVPLWPWDYHQYEPPGSVNHSSLYNCHPKNPCESCKKKESAQLMWTSPPSPPTLPVTETQSSSSLEEKTKGEESTAVIEKVTPVDLDLAIMMMTPRECKIHPGAKCFICSETTDEMLHLIGWIIQGDVLEEEKKGEGIEEEEKSGAEEVIKGSSSTCSSVESDDDSSTNPTLNVSHFQGEKEETDDSAAPSWARVNEGTSGYQSLPSDTHRQPISSEQSLHSYATGTSRSLAESEERVHLQPVLTRARVIPSSRDLNCNCPRPVKYPGSSTSAHADLNIGYHHPVPTSFPPPPPIMHMPYHRVQTYSYAPPPYYPTVSCPPPHAYFAGLHVNYINHVYPFPSHHYPPPGPDAYECRKVQEKLSEDKVRDSSASNYRKSTSALAGTPDTSPRGFQLKSHEFPSLTSQNEAHKTSSNLSPQLGNKSQRSNEGTIKASNDFQGKQVSLSNPYVKHPKDSPVKVTHGSSSPTSPTSHPSETPVKDEQDQVIERTEASTNGVVKANDKSAERLTEGADDSSDETQNAVESTMNPAEDDLEVPTVQVVEEIEAEAVEPDENDPTTTMIDDIEKIEQQSEAIEDSADLESSCTKEKKKTKSKKALKKAKKLAAKAAKSKTELHQPDANGIKTSLSDSKLLIAPSTTSRSRKAKRDLNPDMRIPRSMRIRAMVACCQNLSTVDSTDEEDTATEPASEDESSPEDYEQSRIDEFVDEQQCIDSIPDDFSLIQRRRKKTKDTKWNDKDASVQTE